MLVVDLDGALDGRATNRDLIAEVKKVSGLGIEVGGGIRTLEQIRDYLAVGIDRIIIGSMAVKNPDFVRAALEEFGADKIVLMPRQGLSLLKAGWKPVMWTTSPWPRKWKRWA